MQRGFIQIPILIAIIVITIVGGSAYVAYRKIVKPSQNAPESAITTITNIQAKTTVDVPAETDQRENGLVDKKFNERDSLIGSLEEQIGTPKTTVVTLPSDTVVEIGNVIRTIKETLQQAYTAPTPTAQIQTATSIQISSVNITPTITTVKMEWRTDKPAESKVFLSSDGLLSQIYNSESDFSTRHSVSIGGLKGSTNYSYEIEVTAGDNAYKQTGNFSTQSPPPPTFSITRESVPGPGWPGWNYLKIQAGNGVFTFEALTLEIANPDEKTSGAQTREGYIQSMALAKNSWNYRRCDAINSAFLEWQNKNYPYPCPVSSTNPIYLTMSNPTWQNTKINLTPSPDMIFPPGTEIYYYKVVDTNTGSVFEYQK